MSHPALKATVVADTAFAQHQFGSSMFYPHCAQWLNRPLDVFSPQSAGMLPWPTDLAKNGKMISLWWEYQLSKELYWSGGLVIVDWYKSGKGLGFSTYRFILCPTWMTLAEVLLGGTMGRKYFVHRHGRRCGVNVGDRPQEIFLRITLILIPFFSALVWKQAAGHCGTVGHKPCVIVLAEIDSRMLARSNPLNYCQNICKALLGVQFRPSRCILLVSVGYIPDFGPPFLQLDIVSDDAIVLVSDVNVLSVPWFQGPPQLKPIMSVRVIFYDKPDAMFSHEVWHCHTPERLKQNKCKWLLWKGKQIFRASHLLLTF